MPRHPAAPQESPTRRTAVLIAQIELLVGNLPGILGGSFIAAAVMTWAIGDSVALSLKLVWLLGMTSLLAWRLVHLQKMRRDPTTAANAVQRCSELTWLSGLTAGTWGLFGAATVSPQTPIQSLAVIMLLTGLVASGTAFISHFRRMYLWYIFAMMVPVAIRCLSFGDRDFTLVAGLIALYLAVSVSTSRATGESVLTSIRVRFDNLDQYAELLEEKAVADEARQKAEAANAAKSQFLSSASHDLRQPLHSLRLFSATLMSRLGSRQRVDGAEPDPDVVEDQRLVSRIDESVTALEGLFEGILDLSRLDAGTVRTRFEHLALADVFKQLELSFGASAQIKGVDFQHDAAGIIVQSDAVMLQRMLGNLVANAVRYTDQGFIRVSATQHGTAVRIKVADTGIGIPTDQRERVFEEFVQLSNPERDRRQGVGLGLSIVRRIAILLGAEVSLQAGDDARGSVFNIGLNAGSADRLLPASAVIGAEEQAIDGIFVLVIDDEESARDALEGLIENWGGSVVLASSGAEALEVLSEIDEVPDVIVSDYRLRDGETGTQAIAAIRARVKQELPALLITGDIAAQRLRDIDEAGVPVLHKPCNPDELKMALLELRKANLPAA